MSLRILILGDIVGTPGRLAVAQQLPILREKWRPDLVVANAENAANGSGLTPDLYRKIMACGVDGMTLGDHVYRKKQIVSVLEQEGNIIRPANLPPKAAGRAWMRLVAPERSDAPAVYVFTVLGRLFMNLPANDPFAIADQVLGLLPEAEPIVLVEIHAEATSEKKALGWHLNGRVSAVFGTHTHVPTADATVLPAHVDGGGRATRGGTAYISDLGMCGPHESVIGRRVDRVLTHMTTAMPAPFDVAEGDPRVQGVFLEIDEGSRRALRIESIDAPANTSKPPFAHG